VLFAALLCLAWTAPAAAKERWLEQPLCHAVTPLDAGDAMPKSFTCSGEPEDYQHASLWFRIDPGELDPSDDGVVLAIRNTRFDSLRVVFSYADGTVDRHRVRSGSFGPHASIGGQIVFNAPAREARLTAVTLRFDRLASTDLLSMRLMTRDDSSLQSTALAVTIGAALTLLVIGGVYNAFFALAARRQFPAWLSAWAACMVVWGAIWGQLNLFVLPGMAGVMSAQICTALACLAVTLATVSAVTALDDGLVPQRLRMGTLALGGAIGLFGIPLALMRSGPIVALADILGIMILADLLAVAVALGIAWRRGSREARSFAGAWSLPMLVLASTEFIDTDHWLWGGGSYLLVLCAAAWQTLWISVAVSLGYSRLRVERDMALSAEAQAHELARRDPLTGLRNRRGFIETVSAMFEQARAEDKPVALLLIDVDLFKRINDVHGHDAGDSVLANIASRIIQWEDASCAVARIGGEEFAMMVSGLPRPALARFADTVRKEIAACDHSSAIFGVHVTVSIGVAEGAQVDDFRSLYRLADEALYSAKRRGRDRVEINSAAVGADTDHRVAELV